MSTTYPSDQHHVASNGHPHPHAAPEHAPVAAARARWPFWGLAGAASAMASLIVAFPTLEEEDYTSGVEVVDKLEAGGYRIGFILGLISVGCLLVAAAGWRRWAEARAPRDLASRVVGQGLAVTATVNVVFYGLIGALGLYLPGGVEEGIGMSNEGMFVLHSMLDFGPLLGWWGVTVSAIAVTTLAFRKDRLLPRWMGVASLVLMAMPVGMAVATSLPGLVGFFMPIWLMVVSVGMVFSKTADAAA